MADACIFCKIARGEIPAQMVANNKEIAAFRDLNPQAPVHILIIPKKHIASLDDTADSYLLGQMVSLASAIARQEKIAKSGYRTVIKFTGNTAAVMTGHLETVPPPLRERNRKVSQRAAKWLSCPRWKKDPAARPANGGRLCQLNARASRRHRLTLSARLRALQRILSKVFADVFDRAYSCGHNHRGVRGPTDS